MAAISFALALLAGALWFLSRRLHNQLMALKAAQAAKAASASVRGAETDASLRWVTQLTNLAFGMALAAAVPLVEAIAP
jgi:hypothetical protein